MVFCLPLLFHTVRRRWANLIIGGSVFSKQFLDFLEEVEQLRLPRKGIKYSGGDLPD